MTNTLTTPPTTILNFPIATKAEHAIALSVLVGNVMREKVGKGSVLELDKQQLRATFANDEEFTEALRLHDLVQWIKKVGPYAKEGGE